MTNLQNIFIGKVRNSGVLEDKTRIVHTTDRISAFDFVFPFQVVGKGAILQALSVWFFEQTRHILQNHLIGCLDENHLLVKQANVFPVEIIVRGYLTGSLWRLYEEDKVFETYGLRLEKGLRQHQKLPFPVVTPSTKAETGHDIPLSCLQAAHIVGEREWALMQEKALELFAFGQKVAQDRGLVLVDTKYEMGMVCGQLVLVDEVHTPDSSRYWMAGDETAVSPKHLSKEFLREELLSIFGKPENLRKNPACHPLFQDRQWTQSLAHRLQQRYFEMFSLLVGEKTPGEIMAPFFVPWPVSKEDWLRAEAAALMPRRVLIVGDGGRDYALASAFASLPEVESVYCTALERRLWPSEKFFPCPAQSVDQISLFAREHDIGLVVAGPELPIAQGLSDACAACGVPALSPDLAGAVLETSKILCKNILLEAGLATAQAKVYTWSQLSQMLSDCARGCPVSFPFSFPFVIKYDELAAGKGVFILSGAQDAGDVLLAIERGLPEWQKLSALVKTETYSKTVQEPCFLLEEFLCGEEISVIALCNGEQFRLLPVARDYKRRNTGQQGPNTGGMGAIGPVPLLSDSLEQQIQQAFARVLAYMAKKGTPYHGFLFAGFMVDKQEKAWLLELNCRLGDPEAQVLLPGLGRDFFTELFLTAQRKPFFYQKQKRASFLHDRVSRVFVVAASPEYPEAAAPQRKVLGLDRVSWHEGKRSCCSLIPSAIEPDGTTRGGRAFGVLGAAGSFAKARAFVYQALAQISLQDKDGNVCLPHFRTDIGKEAEDDER